MKLEVRHCRDNRSLGLVSTLQGRVLTRTDRKPLQDAEWWLAAVGGVSVGFGGLKLTGEGTAFLCLSGVLRKYRGSGIQKRLIRVRERFARRSGCVVVYTYTTRDNAPSANSLISSGFRLYEPQYAWVGRDVLYWQKSLTPAKSRRQLFEPLKGQLNPFTTSV